MSYTGIDIQKSYFLETNENYQKKAKKKKEIAEENFKKMYGISDEVYEKNFQKREKLKQ